jgi:hypothetical protein
VENEGEKTKFLVVYILATIKANLDFNWVYLWEKFYLGVFYHSGRSGGWTDPGKVKRLTRAKKCSNSVDLPSRPMTQATQQNPIEIHFFLNVFFFIARNPFLYIYFSWLLTLFKVYYINIWKIFYFFNVKFKAF